MTTDKTTPPPIDTKALRELMRWFSLPCAIGEVTHVRGSDGRAYTGHVGYDDAAGIVGALNAAIPLCDEVERLRARVAEYERMDRLHEIAHSLVDPGDDE